MTHLRRYRTTDAPRCCEVLASSVATMDGLNDAARKFLDSKRTAQAIDVELGAAFTIVAETEADQVCGLACLSGNEIRRLYVDASSQRTGVGGALLRELEDEAVALALKELRIEASPSSVAFYERHGFVAIRAAALRRGEATFDFVLMTKRLTPG